ncbi:hypothetical protein SLEP1_g39857 [Rubroshorea leprosula]|uniref:Uncharacterized protein n=1 Tax=Rubroshorea leprosula TaxID=152421 RepID=A0AAV5L2D2_9ROSI|nr:hypothetical protein SLEP1_g39857 [Rubroshorea leprosula]
MPAQLNNVLKGLTLKRPKPGSLLSPTMKKLKPSQLLRESHVLSLRSAVRGSIKVGGSNNNSRRKKRGPKMKICLSIAQTNMMVDEVSSCSCCKF